MRFVDRVFELKELAAMQALAKKKLFVAALFGLRRVGKTRLLLEFLKGKGIYFFVNKNKTSADLLDEFQRILKKKGILGEMETVSGISAQPVSNTWETFFDVLVKRSAEPVVFDEFQNFGFVEPAVFGILQKNIDLNESRPGFFILSGSLIGLMKNLFKGSKEPLYGRIKNGMKLEPLDLEPCLEIGRILGLEKEELLKTFFIFGGFPKYFVAIEDFGLQGKKAEEILDALLLAKDAPLEEEITGILSQEFGARSGTYYSILEAIANGNNTLSSMASSLSTNPTSITRQVKELRDHFELIEFEMPFEGKRGIYKIKHPLAQFWFSQIYKDYSGYAARKPEFLQKLKKNLNLFYGKAFENPARQFLTVTLELEETKRQWGKIQGAKKGENTYEIDCIGKDAKNTYAFEFKWKELSYRETLVVLKTLQAKTGHLNKKLTHAKFGIVAKKIDNKQKIKNEGYLAYDLEDF